MLALPDASRQLASRTGRLVAATAGFRVSAQSDDRVELLLFGVLYVVLCASSGRCYRVHATRIIQEMYRTDSEREREREGKARKKWAQ